MQDVDEAAEFKPTCGGFQERTDVVHGQPPGKGEGFQQNNEPDGPILQANRQIRKSAGQYMVRLTTII
jgi:hypothetical protein